MSRNIPDSRWGRRTQARCVANPGLTPSFRRTLPETGCLSQGVPHGIRCAWPCPPEPLSTQRIPRLPHPRTVRMLESFFHMAKSIDELEDIAKRVRRDIVQMITAAKSGHPGGSLSAVEIVVELYFNHMRIDPANPKWVDRDRFILSKGHAAPVLYSVMAERGYADAPKDKLNTLRQFGSVFQGHPDMRF